MGREMRYLGAATDPGEWWTDRKSEAEDLGPGVVFYLRVACDGHIAPRIGVAYGLREDVDLLRVAAEAERLIEAYLAEDENHKVYGDLIPPTLDLWRSLDEVLARVKESDRDIAVWGIDSILFSVTGSKAMSDRVIERVGLETLLGLVCAEEVEVEI